MESNLPPDVGLVAFDNNVWRWATEEDPDPRMEKLVDQARSLVSELDKRKCDIAIPIVVLEEWLRTCPPEAMNDAYSWVAEKAHILGYDTGVAIKAAQIYQNEATEVLQELKKQKSRSKQEIYDDIKIIACCLQEHTPVDVLYSHDNDLTQIGKAAGLDVREMPAYTKDLFQDQ